MKIAAYTQGTLTPSTRFRLRQYIPLWRHYGIDTCEFVGDAYPPAQQIRRPLWLGFEVGRRLGQVINGRHADLTFIQRHFVSTLQTLESFTKHPRVLDVDDAIWLHQRFKSVDRIAAKCDIVLCGNTWIADHFVNFSRRIKVVPTAVDTSRFVPSASLVEPGREHLIIGWVGTSANFPHLVHIENALRIVLQEIPSARLLIVADKSPSLSLLPAGQLIFRPWSEVHEIEVFHNIDVGIMPLLDTEWARGKCSFKLLQYLSCGISGVASPVGMNVDVAASGGVVLANTESDWVESLLTLLSEPHLRLQCGANGRANVERNYSATMIAKRLADLFLELT